MSEERISQIPAHGGSNIEQTVVKQGPVNEDLTYPMCLPDPQTRIGYCLRLAGAAAAATLFVVVCWLMSVSVNSETRILAGPILFLQTWGTEDHVIGTVAMLVLLPSIFAVCVRRSVATITLSIIACICWILIGLCIEAIASI